VALVTFAAIVTPPDVFSQLALAIPMYGLYELSIVIARFLEKRSAAAEEDDDEPATAQTPAGGTAAAGAAAPVRQPPALFEENDFNLAR
jgi:hypothetical protein